MQPELVPAPARVRVVRSASHRDVLREASVVVTYAGHGTVLKTLSAGVPLVCIPMGRDQHASATRVLRLGAGARVGKGASASEVADAIRYVLEEPAFTINAGQVARTLATEAATHPNAADEVEAMIGMSPRVRPLTAGGLPPEPTARSPIASPQTPRPGSDERGADGSDAGRRNPIARATRASMASENFWID